MSDVAQFPHGSKEYVRMRITGRDSTGQRIDLSVYSLEMSVTTRTDPPTEPSTFYAGTWEVIGEGDNAIYFAKLLVGPGSTIGQLSIGDKDLWSRPAVPPEAPLLRADGGFEVI